MDKDEFEKLKDKFINEDIEGKIKIYTETPNLDGSQYRELLELYPYESIGELEKFFE
ncbi:MAG: hypothetical protein IAC55_07905 [Tyzzerella sp.]|uniref:Uncharacterized protein n=1 Tax=Candidatus Fimicola merdigallinarum TaxID=2840819 RepID=A0A9D9DZ88_9FIRM|nr:hypothetical protein [Candidatus Fimicola merdigallinarum]